MLPEGFERPAFSHQTKRGGGRLAGRRKACGSNLAAITAAGGRLGVRVSLRVQLRERVVFEFARRVLCWEFEYPCGNNVSLR